MRFFGRFRCLPSSTSCTCCQSSRVMIASYLPGYVTCRAVVIVSAIHPFSQQPMHRRGRDGIAALSIGQPVGLRKLRNFLQ